jgi:signal transduction histidine kinase
MSSATELDTVLIVDDNTTNRHLFKAIVERAGFKSAECENGAECLAYCENSKPLIVLLDVMMPVMNGIEACKNLRRIYPKGALPIIMVTTRDQVENITAGFAAGASDYVTKPVDRNILLARIENQIRIVEYQESLFEANRFTERALRIQGALGDALPQAIIIHDLDGRLIYLNSTARKALGGQDVVGIEQYFSNAYKAAIQDKFTNQLKRALSEEEYYVDEELAVKELNTNLYLQIISKTVKLHSEPPLRIWIIRDISNERSMEKRLSQQVKMETVGLFAMGVAHNFNNIMASIFGAAQIAERSIDKPERIKRCVNIISQAIESGMLLTKRMAMTTDVAVTDQDNANFNKTLYQAWEEVKQRVPDSKEIKFDFSGVHEALDVAMPASQLKVIFGNLLENAIEAMEDGGQIICQINEAEGEKPSDKVTVELIDNGCGMSKDILNRAFEPFFSTKTLDHTNKVSCEGRGLGMWNVYNIIKMAEGDIQLDSSPGKGLRATITLPLSK